MDTPLGPLVHPPFPQLVPGTALRRLLSQVLCHLSLRLGQMAVRLEPTLPPGRRARGALPLLEFHAEAGAPEGALYIDGVLAGHLSGISRL